jgi:hypothetical protein
MSYLESVATAHDLPEALCLRSFLESQGIPTFINGLHHAQNDWWMIFALGGLDVRVPHEHAEEVRDYMRAFRAEPSQCQPASGCFWERPIRSFLLLMLVATEGGIPPLWARKRKWGAVDYPGGWYTDWRAGIVLIAVAGFTLIGAAYLFALVFWALQA